MHILVDKSVGDVLEVYKVGPNIDAHDAGAVVAIAVLPDGVVDDDAPRLAVALSHSEQLVAKVTKMSGRITYDEWQSLCNRRGPLSVSCVQSGRWLRFLPLSDAIAAGAVLYFDVMADDDDGKKERKLCSLAVIKEELQEVLGRIVRDEEKR